jgi:hypothetical protein
MTSHKQSSWDEYRAYTEVAERVAKDFRRVWREKQAAGLVLAAWDRVLLSHVSNAFGFFVSYWSANAKNRVPEFTVAFDVGWERAHLRRALDSFPEASNRRIRERPEECGQSVLQAWNKFREHGPEEARASIVEILGGMLDALGSREKDA